MDTKQQIIELWKKTREVHPSASEIADKVGVNRSYVWRVVSDYQKDLKLRSKGRI